MNNRTNTKNPQAKLAGYTNSNWKQVDFKANNGYKVEYSNRQSNQQNYNNDKYCHEVEQIKKNRNYTNFQDRKGNNYQNRTERQQNFNLNNPNYDTKKKRNKENLQNYQDETSHYQQFYINNDDYRRCITSSNQNLAYVKNANPQFTRVNDHCQMMTNVYESKI